MTEEEKMLNGILYNANEETLVEKRKQAKQICCQYNQAKYDDIDNKKEYIKTLLKKTGEFFIIEPDFWCDYGKNISIGENFYVNHHCVILDAAEVRFGDNVMIGPNCGFYTAGHPINIEERNKGLEYAKPIYIGNNVWIGGNVTILPGVTIGDNVTIGGGSVVTKDIPSNVIAYGNPCKVIKEINNS